MASPPQEQSFETERRARVLDHLLRTEHGRLIHQARYHSRHDADAEDALSDACVQFLRFYPGPPGVDALRWMLLVTKRCAWAIRRKATVRESRQRTVEGNYGNQLEESFLRDDRFGTAELVERTEETTAVWSLIDDLKPDERAALILLGLGCSHKEIRDLQGWTETKVNRCLTEGRARVRKMLERGGS